MAQSDRLNTLAHLQTRIAALYAIQNEELQRHKAATSRSEIAAQSQRARNPTQRTQTQWVEPTSPEGFPPTDGVDLSISHGALTGVEASQ